MATDQVSFYDESLKKQIEGSFSNFRRCKGVEAIAVGAAGAVQVPILERGRRLTDTPRE
jgi:hypothetical protein